MTMQTTPNKDNIFTVSEVNLHVKHILESNMPNMYIEGEIANFTHHNSGHIYLSLKDEKSTIKCVFFKSYNRYLTHKPKRGDNVICLGKITVYERGGNYKFIIVKMIPSGKGLLEVKFEQLKKKLQEEGLFDEKLKKTIPLYPGKIGVITSATGAAIRDIENVIKRRFPCEIILHPAVVQGDSAPKTLIRGLRYFNNREDIDVIIIGRGGGSQEDLFCFNDEQLAREIASSNIPIISAVGHEIDFTIADFVADLRAPTPSAAAELAVPDKEELFRQLKSLDQRLTSFVNSKLFTYKLILSNTKNQLQSYKPENLILNFQQTIDEAELKLNHLITRHLENRRQQLTLLQAKLQTLSPYNALQRGYSLIRKESRIINSIIHVAVDDKIEVSLSDGLLNCKIEEIKDN